MKKSIQEQRREQIILLLSKHNFLSVTELSDLLKYSEATIKRDLTKLSNDGLIRRTRGGAVIIDENRVELPYVMKIKDEKNSHKIVMAEKAKKILKDDLTLFLDSSSTVLYLAKHTGKYKNLKIITNGLFVASYLCEHSLASVNIIGGNLVGKKFTINGTLAYMNASNYNVNLAILSCRGFDFEKGATEVSSEEASMKKIFQKNASKVVLMASSHKLGKIYTHNSLNLDEIDYFVTDKVLNNHELSILSRYNIEVL